MFITESELRELWRDGRNALPSFSPGTRFSPAAQDFLKEHGLTPVFAETAAPPLSISNLKSPVSFLARLDTLHALTGLVAAEARRARLPELAAHLDTLTAYCGELHAAANAGRSAPGLVWGSGPLTSVGGRPGPHDHAVAHWLNTLRASAREAELAAPETLRPSIHRLADAVEDLLGQFLGGNLAWQAGG